MEVKDIRNKLIFLKQLLKTTNQTLTCAILVFYIGQAKDISSDRKFDI